MVKRVDQAVYQTIKDVQDGTFTAGTKVYDLKADGVGLHRLPEYEGSSRTRWHEETRRGRFEDQGRNLQGPLDPGRSSALPRFEKITEGAEEWSQNDRHSPYAPLVRGHRPDHRRPLPRGGRHRRGSRRRRAMAPPPSFRPALRRAFEGGALARIDRRDGSMGGAPPDPSTALSRAGSGSPSRRRDSARRRSLPLWSCRSRRSSASTPDGGSGGDLVVRSGFMASLVVIMTFHSRRFQTTHESARRDALTGALNRAGFETAARETIDAALDAHETLTFAVIDCDNFKDLNDVKGHRLRRHGPAHPRPHSRRLATRGDPSDAREATSSSSWTPLGTRGR